MGIFIKQLLSGRDFAREDRHAVQMANFVYLIGDDETRECVVVDPAWDIAGILNEIDRLDLTLKAALATHYHPDHIGGNFFGFHVEGGISQLQELRPVKVYVNEAEAEGVKRITGVSDNDLVKVCGGDQLEVGGAAITFLHTPGHTPGSQCFLVGSSLISGDTLFIGACGRVDLPGGDSEQLYHSLTQVLAKLPDATCLYPGHNYAAQPTSTIGDERQSNIFMRMTSLDDWQRLWGMTSL
jgi:hydroxyacylglutathione hydrolase